MRYITAFMFPSGRTPRQHADIRQRDPEISGYGIHSAQRSAAL
jgi:hypothetical protein